LFLFMIFKAIQKWFISRIILVKIILGGKGNVKERGEKTIHIVNDELSYPLNILIYFFVKVAQ